MKHYKILTSGMVIKPGDEILHRGKWCPATDFRFQSPRWRKHIKPMRRKITEKGKVNYGQKT